jgi:hypothetical protein
VINRLLVLLAVALGALALSAVPSANLGDLAGVGVARAQAPVDPNSDDSALDDTAVGGLDQTDLPAPLDETDTPPVDNPAPPAAAPPAPATTPPTPAAPVPTTTAPPVVTAPGAPTGSTGKWVRISVRVGDTVRKIAARRGHPEKAAAIVKRNKTVKGKRTIRSRGTKLRHGAGATKSTRKKDRRKLWVPAS